MKFLPQLHFFPIIVLMGGPFAGSGLAQERLTNPGFESGTLTGNVSFAGGTNNAVSLASQAPSNWAYESTINGNTDLWVQSPQAHGGNRYLYLSSDGSTDTNDDSCMRNIVPAGTKTITGLNGSVAATNTLRICLWAANGQAAVSQLNIEVQQFDVSGTLIPASLTGQDPEVLKNPTSTVLYKPFNINPNANGWTPTTTGVVGGIPWQLYCVDILLAPTARSADVWYSAADPFSVVGKQVSSIVLDDASLTVVPEPTQAGMLLLSLGSLLIRRRRVLSPEA